MTLIEALTELVIVARERADAQDTAQIAANAVERRIERLRVMSRRREVRNGADCARCGRRTRAGMLCLACCGEAPAAIRTAFAKASGLDGMRAATRQVNEYARGQERKEAA